MKKALISPNEQVSYISGWDGQNPVYTELGQRVAEVCDAEFEVATPLFWLDCADDVVADQFYYDGTAIQAIPESPPKPTSVQPTTTGTQTL
jgi:hypothetical protein